MSNVELDDELLDPVSSGLAPSLQLSALPAPRKVAARSCGGAEQGAGVNSQQEGDRQQAGPCRARGQMQAVLCNVAGQVWALSAELGDKVTSRPWAPRAWATKEGGSEVSPLRPTYASRDGAGARQEVALSLSCASAGRKARGAGSTCGTGALSGQEVSSGDWDLRGQGPSDLYPLLLPPCQAVWQLPGNVS